MQENVGRIVRGINNIYSVVDGEHTYLCRIKGKQLSSVTGEYNPLAVGDLVSYVGVGGRDGLILERKERRNSFRRWNVKGQCNQTVVANMDLVVVVASAANPPFRPRFVDRAIVCCHDVPVMVVLNKSDLSMEAWGAERFRLYGQLGYPTLAVSALKGDGVGALKRIMEGKTVAFVGQSGVGKSSLINRLMGTELRTNTVSEKYDRGRHTTNFALMMTGPSFTLVDTPGVRELLVPHGDRRHIAASFPEFREAASGCLYDGCLHDKEEGCRVRQLVEEGKIHRDRYESYVRMLASLAQRAPAWVGKREQSKARYKSKEEHGYEEY